MKRALKLIAALLLAASLLCTAALADMGPKPSVRISFEGLSGGAPCWGTLLSREGERWPGARAYDGTNPNYGEAGEEIWRQFVEYRDPDGYYFLQELWLCSENGRLDWTYFAPEDFKVLLYFPQTGEFVSGGIERAYAYDSYYTASFTDGGIALERSYDYTDEAVGFAVRCVLTIAIELAMAYFAFRLREKRQVAVVAAVNAATQGALNLALNLIAYFCGGMAAMLRFLGMGGRGGCEGAIAAARCPPPAGPPRSLRSAAVPGSRRSPAEPRPALPEGSAGRARREGERAGGAARPR